MTGRMTLVASVVSAVADELEDDFVGLWVVPWHIRRALPEADDAEVQEIASAVLTALLARGARLGELDESTGAFREWPRHDAAGRAMMKWVQLGRDPSIGEVGWLANEPLQPSSDLGSSVQSASESVRSETQQPRLVIRRQRLERIIESLVLEIEMATTDRTTQAETGSLQYALGLCQRASDSIDSREMTRDLMLEAAHLAADEWNLQASLSRELLAYVHEL
jgi:hypothetical protein